MAVSAPAGSRHTQPRAIGDGDTPAGFGVRRWTTPSWVHTVIPATACCATGCDRRILVDDHTGS